LTETIEQLAFCSHAPSRQEALRGLPDLLEVARRNNRAQGLTGAIAVGRSGYFQVMEGGRDAIDRTIARINRDGRHCNVRIVSRQSISGRLFSAWTLACPSILPSLRLQIDLAIDTCTEHPEAAISLLRSITVMQALHHRRSCDVDRAVIVRPFAKLARTEMR
jgi:hypothetical protein